MNKTEHLIEDTKKELKVWFESPVHSDDSFYLNSIKKIKEMLDSNNILKSVILNYNTINTWYRNNFVYSSLSSDNNVDYRIKTAFSGYQIVSLADAMARKYPNNPPRSLSFDFAAYHLADVIIMNWNREAQVMIKFINQALGTQILKGGLDFKITSWFILEVVNKGFKIDYDYSEFNYPEDMGVYRKALDNWNTTDLNLLDEMISELCTFHIFQASHGSLSDSAGKSDPMFLQFSHTSWFVYAFEVLAWLAMREQQGLKNPDTFLHSLMNIPLNQLTKKSVKMPDDELFNKIMQKIQ